MWPPPPWPIVRRTTAQLADKDCRSKEVHSWGSGRRKLSPRFGNISFGLLALPNPHTVDSWLFGAAVHASHLYSCVIGTQRQRTCAVNWLQTVAEFRSRKCKTLSSKAPILFNLTWLWESCFEVPPPCVSGPDLRQEAKPRAPLHNAASLRQSVLLSCCARIR